MEKNFFFLLFIFLVSDVNINNDNKKDEIPIVLSRFMNFSFFFSNVIKVYVTRSFLSNIIRRS